VQVDLDVANAALLGELLDHAWWAKAPARLQRDALTERSCAPRIRLAGRPVRRGDAEGRAHAPRRYADRRGPPRDLGQLLVGNRWGRLLPSGVRRWSCGGGFWSHARHEPPLSGSR
jgi:hypothetical protein